MLPSELDVVRCTGADAGRLVVGERTAHLGRHAGHQRAGRDLRPLEHHRAGGDERPGADRGRR